MFLKTKSRWISTSALGVVVPTCTRNTWTSIRSMSAARNPSSPVHIALIGRSKRAPFKLIYCANTKICFRCVRIFYRRFSHYLILNIYCIYFIFWENVLTKFSVYILFLFYYLFFNCVYSVDVKLQILRKSPFHDNKALAWVPSKP